MLETDQLPDPPYKEQFCSLVALRLKAFLIYDHPPVLACPVKGILFDMISRFRPKKEYRTCLPD